MEFIIIGVILLGIVFTVLPLVKVFKGQVSKLSAKKRLTLHVVMFFTLIFTTLILAPSVFGATDEQIVAAIQQNGMGYIAAALATGFSALGAGIAVAAAAPAAIGAISENEKNFGKSLIFVALGEGVAIYGLLISILILNNLTVA